MYLENLHHHHHHHCRRPLLCDAHRPYHLRRRHHYLRRYHAQPNIMK